LEHGDLPVVDLYEIAQGLHPDRVGLIEPHLVQERLAFGAEDVLESRDHALLGQHRVHLGLQPRAQGNELGPIPDQLP
jgi:hypothetical protein